MVSVFFFFLHVYVGREREGTGISMSLSLRETTANRIFTTLSMKGHYSVIFSDSV